jgi:hypothetical protein
LDAVVTSAMAVELQEQLLARERELDSREGILMAREDGLADSECTIGRRAWNVIVSATEPRLFGRTIWLGLSFYSRLPAFP